MGDIEFNVTLLLIIVTIITTIMAWRNETMWRKWIFNPYMIRNRKEVWRFLTCAFLHADWMHLGFNMFALYMFGSGVERQFDVEYLHEDWKQIVFFLGLYIPGAILANFYSYEKHKKDIYYNALGASGATSAVVFAYIAIKPVEPLYVFFAIKTPAFIYGFLFLTISYILARRAKDNIGHDAHFFGALYGFMYMFIIQPDKFNKFLGSVQYYFQHLF